VEGSSIVFPGEDVEGSGLCGVFEDLMHHLWERQLLLTFPIYIMFHKGSVETKMLEKDDRSYHRNELHDDNNLAYLVFVLLGALCAFCSHFPPVIDIARCYNAW
jgi:hypothetical protein